MQFSWNADTIRWYLSANDFSGFYKKSAAAIAPALEGYSSLCDVGCGLALFDFEVASLFDKIECVDINENALSSVRERAAKLGITNIITRVDDGEKLAGAWDVIYMSFFGSRELDRYLPYCKKLFAVVSVTSESEMFPVKRRHKRNTVEDTKNHLENNGIEYRLTYHQFEFGQPFASLNDARECIRTYTPEIDDNELDEYVKIKLKNTGDEDYPYYIPRSKSIGIFEIHGSHP